jgi:hypothetical protein
LQNHEDLAMGKVEDDRRRGFVLEVLFKGEVAFKDTDGCGYRTDERVIYRQVGGVGKKSWWKYRSRKNWNFVVKRTHYYIPVYNNKD